MTIDPHDFDELASAYLDGVASPEEAARVDADPALQARVEELRAVRAALAEVPEVDAIRRDAAIAAALAAFDEEGAEPDAALPVVPLAPRRRLSPTTVRVLGAAAVVAILALLVPLLTSISGGEDEASVESAGDALESAEDAGTDGPDDVAEPEEVPTASDSGSRDAYLGAFPDVDALAEAMESAPRGTQEYAQTGREQAANQLCTTARPVGARVGTAVVADEPVVVWLGATPEGLLVLTVVRVDGCEVIEKREL